MSCVHPRNRMAVWALGYVGDASDRERLAARLADPSERVRDFAAAALARGKEKRGAERALAAIADPARPPIRRGELAVALADGGHKEAIPVPRAQPAVAPRELRARLEEALALLN